jgi:hypothetical protein
VIDFLLINFIHELAMMNILDEGCSKLVFNVDVFPSSFHAMSCKQNMADRPWRQKRTSIFFHRAEASNTMIKMKLAVK